MPPLSFFIEVQNPHSASNSTCKAASCLQHGRSSSKLKFLSFLSFSSLLTRNKSTSSRGTILQNSQRCRHFRSPNSHLLQIACCTKSFLSKGFAVVVASSSCINYENPTCCLPATSHSVLRALQRKISSLHSLPS